MRSGWNLGKQGSVAATVSRLKFSTETILLAYDGPQVLTVRDEYGARHLAVAADESIDGETVRWIYAGITDLEYCALTVGALSVRDALIKDSVIIIDYQAHGGKPIKAWRIPASEVPEDAQPDRDSILPPEVCAQFASSDSSEPEIRIGGKSIVHHAIPFVDVGAITSMLQKLWHGLSGSIYYSKRPVEPAIGEGFLPSTLLMSGTGPGSVAIKVRPANNDVFNRIAHEYKMLLGAADSESELRSMLARYKPDVAESCGEYLEFLGHRELEVFTSAEQSSAFIGPSRARRVRPNFARGKKKRTAEQPAQIKDVSFVATGYFEGYSYHSRTFDFYDKDRGKLCSGTVEDSVLTRTPIERGLIISSKTIYKAELRHISTGDRNQYHLLGFWLPSDESK